MFNICPHCSLAITFVSAASPHPNYDCDSDDTRLVQFSNCSAPPENKGNNHTNQLVGFICLCVCLCPPQLFVNSALARVGLVSGLVCSALVCWAFSRFVSCPCFMSPQLQHTHTHTHMTSCNLPAPFAYVATRKGNIMQMFSFSI